MNTGTRKKNQGLTSRGAAKKSNSPLPKSTNADLDYELVENMEVPSGKHNSERYVKLRELVDSLPITKSGEKGTCIQYKKSLASTITYIIANDYHSVKNGKAFITRKINDGYRGVWRVK